MVASRWVTRTTVRAVGVAFWCSLFLSCGRDRREPGPAGGAPSINAGAMEQLDRLRETLDRVVELLQSEDTSGQQVNTELQREVETLQGFADGSGPEGALPFQTQLQRIVSILSESDEGRVSPESKDDVRAEILAIREMLDAGVDIDSFAPQDGGNAFSRPGPGGARPGPPGSTGSGPAGPGPGPGSSMGSAAPDASTMQLEMDSTKRSAEEAVWRAKASATRMAVEQTSAAYEQSKTLHPGPGMSPSQVDQMQAAAKAANDAAVKAQDDLREEARRAGAQPGWLRES
jgi:hypothetical protein